MSATATYCADSGEIAHPNRRKAIAQLTSLKTRKGYAGQVYRCASCSAWHVGRSKKTRPRPKVAGR